MNPVEIVYRYGGEASARRERPATAGEAHSRLNEGNRTFAGLFTSGSQAHCARCVIDVDSSNVGIAPGGPAAALQRPFAAVLGCADARVPIELIFNEGPNDLFVVRVAGNTLGGEVQGSLDYALEHLDDLKLISVLGHSGCGAVTAAVDVLLDPKGYLSLATKHAVRSVVDRLHVVVHASERRLKAALGPDAARHPRFREALIELAIATNAALSAHTLQQEIDYTGPAGVEVVYGVYVLEDRAVWSPRCGSGEVAGLAHPPRDEKDFVELGDAILRSRRIAELLE